MQQINEREQWSNWKPTIDSTELDTLLLKHQLYCVVQTSHKETAIRSPDGKAWLRCIAFAPTLDAAYVIARGAHDQGDNMETRILQTGKCALISSTKRVKGDFEKMLEDQRKANRIYTQHVLEREAVLTQPIKKQEDSDKTSELVETEQTQSSSSETPAEKDAEIKNSQNIAEKLAAPCEPISMEFGKTTEVFLQRFFALGVIQDPTEYEEPVVLPLCAAETMEELQELVKPLSNNKDLLHIDIFCGPTMQWLPLHKPKSSKTIHKHPLRQALEEKLKWVHEE